MIGFKNDSINSIGLSAQLVLGITVVDQVLSKYDIECVITSLNDGRHSQTSLHNSGNAVDIRSKSISDNDTKWAIVRQVNNLLRQDYDFILEGINSSNEHFHLEYQPKRR